MTVQGAVGGTTALTSLNIRGGQVELDAVATTGAIAVTGTNIDLNGATYTSDDGAITFRGPVNLLTTVSIDSDANDDGTDGAIRFTSTIDGAQTLTLDADGGNINFDGGSTDKLGAMTIIKAHNVTVGTSMRVASFQQRAGTGTTDFGLRTISSDSFVKVSTRDIRGRIIAKDATLKGRNFIGVTVEVDSLTIEAKSADIKGMVGDVGGQGAANNTVILNRSSGPYKLNRFTILGTERGTRHYAELAALPLPKPTRRWGVPGDAMFPQFSPIVRGSVVAAMDRSYPTNVFELPFALLKPQAGVESIYDVLPGVIRDVWWRHGTDIDR